MSIGKQSVGEFLYVFSKNDGNKANSTCVIDCHGEQFLFGNTRGVEFAVRSGVSLYFYVQHNDPLNFDIHDMTHGKSYGDDPDDYIFSSTLKEISMGSKPAVETVTGGNTSKD